MSAATQQQLGRFSGQLHPAGVIGKVCSAKVWCERVAEESQRHPRHRSAGWGPYLLGYQKNLRLRRRRKPKTARGPEDLRPSGSRKSRQPGRFWREFFGPALLVAKPSAVEHPGSNNQPRQPRYARQQAAAKAGSRDPGELCDHRSTIQYGSRLRRERCQRPTEAWHATAIGPMPTQGNTAIKRQFGWEVPLPIPCGRG